MSYQVPWQDNSAEQVAIVLLEQMMVCTREIVHCLEEEQYDLLQEQLDKRQTLINRYEALKNTFALRTENRQAQVLIKEMFQEMFQLDERSRTLLNLHRAHLEEELKETHQAKKALKGYRHADAAPEATGIFFSQRR